MIEPSYSISWIASTLWPSCDWSLIAYSISSYSLPEVLPNLRLDYFLYLAYVSSSWYDVASIFVSSLDCWTISLSSTLAFTWESSSSTSWIFLKKSSCCWVYYCISSSMFWFKRSSDNWMNFSNFLFVADIFFRTSLSRPCSNKSAIMADTSC